ncbi:DUF4817 domain-containing protein [Trichonephila clavipes]|nr:DUF4817 domain-containing protein [Trichonephila clavipes]
MESLPLNLNQPNSKRKMIPIVHSLMVFKICEGLDIQVAFSPKEKRNDSKKPKNQLVKRLRKLESWRIEHELDDHAVEIEENASEAASGTSSAREAARRLGLPPSSVHNILRRILQLYPYKLQSCNELLPADTTQREAFAKWAFSKMGQVPTWVFNILWTDEALFSLHGNVNNHNCRIWATSNPREYTQNPLHSPKVTAWCGFTGSFIIGPFFFEKQCPVNGWITEMVNTQRHLTLLRETVVPCLIQRDFKINELSGSSFFPTETGRVDNVELRSPKGGGFSTCIELTKLRINTGGNVTLCRNEFRRP